MGAADLRHVYHRFAPRCRPGGGSVGRAVQRGAACATLGAMTRTSAQLIVLCAWFVAGRAVAAPEWVRLSLTAEPSTSAGIAWNTLRGAPEAEVQYGAAAGALARRARGRVTPSGHAALGAVSEVTLTGLAAATRYFYRVGGPRGGWSEVRAFRTAPRPHPRCGRVRFVVIGDSRSTGRDRPRGPSVRWPLLALKAATHRPDFLLHTGDLVLDGRHGSQWARLLQTSTVVSGRLPIMPCLGNHDDGPGEGDGAYYNKVFHLPRAATADGGSGTEDYYAFRWGPALFVALSSESFVGGKKGPTRFAAQAAWLHRVLQRTDARWKVVYLHRPIYTRPPPFGHKPDEAGQNRAFLPALQRHGVDLVLAGHNHFYERFAPSRCPAGQLLQPCPAAVGTVHVTTAGGGAPVIPFGWKTDRARPAAASAYHFVLVELEPGRMRLRAIDERGKTLDDYTYDKPPAKGAACGGQE